MYREKWVMWLWRGGTALGAWRCARRQGVDGDRPSGRLWESKRGGTSAWQDFNLITFPVWGVAAVSMAETTSREVGEEEQKNK